MVQPIRGRLVYHNTAGGSGRFVAARVHPTIDDAMSRVCASAASSSMRRTGRNARSSYREVDYRQPFALVMGAEKRGLSEAAAEAADEHLTIPMVGMVESYNVSVAAAIILEEAMHQRRQAGLYERPFEEDSGYRATLVPLGAAAHGRLLRPPRPALPRTRRRWRSHSTGRSGL